MAPDVIIADRCSARILPLSRRCRVCGWLVLAAVMLEITFATATVIAVVDHGSRALAVYWVGLLTVETSILTARLMAWRRGEHDGSSHDC